MLHQQGLPSDHVIGILKELRYMKIEHIKKYLKYRFNHTEREMDSVLIRLRTSGKVILHDDYILLRGSKPDPTMLRSIDLMMSICKGSIINIYGNGEIFKIMFSCANKQGEELYYGIVFVRPWSEDRLCRLLKDIHGEVTIIFVIDRIEQHELFSIDTPHYFATQNDDGTFKFFRPTKQKDL